MVLVSILTGYILGTISPAYILGRLLKKIDIREVGEKNAGTTNVYKVLGLAPAVITAIFDLTKGLLAMFVASRLGASELVVYSAGLAAVVGHIFPFYLKFRGGQGAATSTGLLLYFLFILLREHFLPLSGLGVLAVAVVAILTITRQKGFLSLVVMPSLAVMIFRNYGVNLTAIFTGIILVYLFALNVYLAVQKRLFVLKKTTLAKIRPWRTLARPLAAVFPSAYFFIDKSTLLWIMGGIGGVFLAFDLARLISRKFNLAVLTGRAKVLKPGEEKRFSSMTLFLLAAFIVVLIFLKPIAITALVFLIFGDVFAKFFGLEYGRKRLLGDKTLEGSLAHLVICLLAGYIIWLYLGLSPAVIIIGALAATVVEALPLGINDNFSVGVLSAAAMFVAERWL